MPTLNLVTELTVDDLLSVVAELDDNELAEFEIRFEQLWLTRSSSFDIATLHINRPAVQRFRAALLAVGLHPAQA